MYTISYSPSSSQQWVRDQFFNFSAKIVVHLSQPEAGSPTGPISGSRYDFVRLSFRDGGQAEVTI